MATLLSAEEVRRAQTYRSKEAFRSYVVSHGAMRLLLAERVGVAPASLRVRLDCGKPALDGYPLEFNLSHSGDLALLAVAVDSVGIDIEKIRPELWSDHLAAIVVPAHSSQMSPLDLTREWVKREARAKVTGKGITGEHDSEDTPCVLIPIAEGYVAAVAARAQPQPVISWWKGPAQGRAAQYHFTVI